MAYQSARSHIPIVPPGEDELPYDDGEPMETEQHRRQMTVLIQSFEVAWADRQDYYIGGNMFLYYSELQVKHNDFRGPDVFVVLDVERRVRKSWVSWQEGKTPDVVIELISESTEDVDRGEKKAIYGRKMRVPNYFLYDPITHELEGYRLDQDARQYDPIAPDQRGDLPCDVVGYALGVRQSAPEGYDGRWLRWIDADGVMLPTPNELALSQRARAEEEARRAEEQARRAEEQARRAEEQARRADRLAEKLATYERRFGALKDED